MTCARRKWPATAGMGDPLSRVGAKPWHFCPGVRIHGVHPCIQVLGHVCTVPETKPSRYRIPPAGLGHIRYLPSDHTSFSHRQIRCAGCVQVCSRDSGTLGVLVYRCYSRMRAYILAWNSANPAALQLHAVDWNTHSRSPASEGLRCRGFRDLDPDQIQIMDHGSWEQPASLAARIIKVCMRLELCRVRHVSRPRCAIIVQILSR